MRPSSFPVRSTCRLAFALGIPMMAPILVRAQQQDTTANRNVLPRDVAVEVVALFNATTALRTTDPTTIESDQNTSDKMPRTFAGVASTWWTFSGLKHSFNA